MSSPASGASRPFDFARGFTYVFDDPDWLKKVAIGGVFALLATVLVGAFFVMGYVVRVVRRVANGDARPLPEWDDLGGIFSDGLPAIGAYLAYAFGTALLLSPFFCMFAFMGPGIGALFGDRDAAGAAGGFVMVLGMMGFYAAIFVLSFALWFWLPAAFLRLCVTGNFGGAFEFGEIFGFIRRNLVNYLLTLAAFLVASFVAQFGFLLCCVGVFATSFLANLVLAYDLGELARIDAGR